MPDDKQSKLAPPQWLGRPIVHPDHVMDLETRAAIGEFHHKLPRAEAEQKAHDSYVQEQRERAAGHHMAGMKAAMATGNHEDARKHWALYDLHVKALGKESIGPIPPEIEKRMMEENGQKPLYRFKAHKGDLFALHEPSKDTAPPQGQPIQKSDEGGYKDALARIAEQDRIAKTPHPNYDPLPDQHKERLANSHGVSYREYQSLYAGGPDDYRSYRDRNMRLHIAKDGAACTKCQGNGLQKSEAKQCKWKLGERRCKRMVTTDYCHDHVDHWANKIKQKEVSQTPPAEMAKADMPPAGTGGLAAPPAAPQLHSTVDGFMAGLKAMPKGTPERGKYITRHMNHAPFLAALKAHPQGATMHAQLTQFMNSAANAGFKAGATKVMAKREAALVARKVLKGVYDLLKGQLIKFPGQGR